MAQKTITPDPISAFMGQEFLRSSQFLMFMPINAFISPTTSREIGMFCESVEFPGINAITTDYKMPGLNRIKVPYGKEYSDVTLTFIHNVSSPIYHELLSWVRNASNIVNSIDYSSTSVPYFDDYVANFKLFQLTDINKQKGRFDGLSKILSNIDKLNARLLNSDNLFDTTRVGQNFVSNFNAVTTDRNPRSIYYNLEFYNAYPTSIQSMVSNWGEDNFHRVTATFTYEYFTVNDVDSGTFKLTEDDLFDSVQIG